ncbi:MFS transporter [uncultured Sphingomonas sp.]|uniref:MFS transporter n=1 Tax=uncultured Sphingomonas sp. TaxID=158754 RepID=UPI0025F6FEA4|nr:MFS transporter [uncultured Sphingomonas sp.]
MAKRRALPAKGATSDRALVWTYGAAHGGKTLLWAASDLYFTFFMTEICGVAPLYAGLAIGCSLLFAGLADLVLVRWVSDFRSATGSARLQAWGAFASAGALLLFAAIAFLPPTIRLGAGIVTLFGFRAAYALLDVPQNALLALAPSNDEQRRRLTAVRNGAGAIARTILAIAFVPVMAGARPDASFLLLVVVLVTMALGGAVMLARITPEPPPKASRAFPSPARAHDMLYLTAMMAVLTIMTTIFGQVEPYLAMYGMGGGLSAGAFLGTVAAGTVLSQTVWLRATVRAGPRSLLGWALAMMVVGSGLLVPAPRGVLGVGVAAALLYGIGAGGVLFVLWSGIAQSGARGNALATIGRFTAIAKSAQGCAIIAVGAMFDGGFARTDGQALAMMMAAATLVGAIVVAALTWVCRGQRDAMLT